MPILLVLIVALASGDQYCSGSNSAQECSDTVLALADTSVIMLPADERRHIADVTPPGKAKAKLNTAEPARAEEPAPPSRPDQPSQSRAATSAPEPAPQLDPPSDARPEPAPSPEATELTGGWAVQIAAFGDRDSAEQGVDRIGLDEVIILRTRRSGKDWYVLLLGSYSSKDEAESAGRDYATNTGGSYWVRDAYGLKKIQRSE